DVQCLPGLGEVAIHRVPDPLRPIPQRMHPGWVNAPRRPAWGRNRFWNTLIDSRAANVVRAVTAGRSRLAHCSTGAGAQGALAEAGDLEVTPAGQRVDLARVHLEFHLPPRARTWPPPRLPAPASRRPAAPGARTPGGAFPRPRPGRRTRPG